MRKIKRFCFAFTAFAMLCIGLITAMACGYDDAFAGTYQIKAKLSCYVNAMGGVEFGAPLLVSASVEVAADGSKMMTLHFTKSQVTIYGITCDTFIDVSPSYITETNGIKSGTLGYYNADGILITDSVTYTLSDDTAENAQKEQVHYVDSVRFPIDHESDIYYLTLYVNSNVMGTQFTKDGYTAALSVDWSSLSVDVSSNGENTLSDSDITDKQDPPSNGTNVKNKDGLNIYHVDKEAEDETEASETTVAGYYVAYFREPLLIAVAVMSGIMIVSGIVLIVLGRKEKKHE